MSFNIKNYLKNNKNIFSSLISIFGIGFTRARYICDTLNIPFFKKSKFLTNSEIKSIFNKVNLFKTSDFLKREIKNNINKLIEIKCYRGTRHEKNLPVRGQNTKNNARTRKGKKKIINFKKRANVKISKKKKR